MNALKSIATKLAIGIVGTGLVAGAVFAGSGTVVTVTLPEAVNVGSTTLASGRYTINQFPVSGAASMFIFHSDKGETASVMGSKTADAAIDQKTTVVLSREGGTLHVDKMFIEGERSGFQFADSK